MKKKLLTVLISLLFTTPVYGATVVKTIGATGKDYTTIELWEADLDNASVYSAGDAAVGELYNEVYGITAEILIDGGAIIGLSSIKLTSPLAERHDGTAGSGARIIATGGSDFNMIAVESANIPTTIEWIELDANGRDLKGGIYFSKGTGGVSVSDFAKNNIVHGFSGVKVRYGIVNATRGLGSTYRTSILNNIIYDFTMTGTNSIYLIRNSGGSAGRTGWIQNNTVYNGVSTLGVVSGIYVDDNINNIIQNNISMNVEDGDFTIASYLNATANYNLSSDTTASGTGSFVNKLDSSQFISTVEGSPDFLHLKATADAVDTGIDLGTVGGVNFDINGRDRDAEGDVWDIGAGENVNTDVSKSDVPYALSVSYDNKALFEFISSDIVYSATSTTSINDGKWHNVTATYDGSSIKMYINGVLEDVNTDPSGDLPVNVGNVRIGADYQPVPANFFNNDIDSVRLYNRALSENEVTRLYHLGVTTKINKTIKSAGSPLESGLMGHWTFDGKDMISNVTDVSGTGNHGFVSGQISTTTSIGVIGQALNFDGIDDYVEIADIDISASGTVTGWMKFDDLATDQALTGLGGAGSEEFQIWMDDNGVSDRFGISIYNGVWQDVYGTTIPNTSDWWHIAFTYDGTVGKLFVNGIKEGNDLTASFTNKIVNWRIGMLENNTKIHNGSIDDVRVYNKVLTANEILRLYNFGK